MAASSRLMITDAERRFPARIQIGVPPEGLGRQLADHVVVNDDVDRAAREVAGILRTHRSGC